MLKLNMVIADSDELYLNQLTNYIMEKNSALEVYSFTTKASLIKYIESGSSKIDVIAFTEDMADGTIGAANISAKIILSDGSYIESQEYAVVHKYQKTEKLINDILMVYADKTGRIDAVTTGDKPTKIIGMYSPVGGCGKTTLALALAMAASSRGIKTFYLSCEKITSVMGILPMGESGSMSDVYLALKTKGANVGLKIIANKFTEPTTGITYINPPESSLESNELTVEEIKRLIQELEGLGEFDIVIVDFDSEFDTEKMKQLESCDRIIMPFTSDSLAANKIKVLLQEFKLHENLTELSKKIHLIVNKADANTNQVLQQMGVTDNKAIEAMIPLSPIFADIRNVFHAGESLAQTLSPLVNILM